MIYTYTCPKCKTSTEQEEPMAEHSYKNPGPNCTECDQPTIQQLSGSPMFKLNWKS